MCLQRRHQRLRVGARACKFWLPLLTALLLTPALDAKTGELSGVIFTVGKDRVQTVWPDAHVTLKNVTAHREVSSVSNDVGVYRFAGLPVGDYEVIVALAGFETITKRVTIHEGPASRLDFQLVLKKHTEILTVTAEPKGIDLSSSSGGAPALTADVLKSAVRLCRLQNGCRVESTYQQSSRRGRFRR
jgi:hypothetical protein